MRNNIIGPDMRTEHYCYLEEPEQYDYFSHSATGLLLNSIQNSTSVEQAVAQIEKKNAEKQNRREMAERLRAITGDCQDIPQEMKDFLNSELDAASADSSATMFEEYQVDSSDQLIKLQLWFLTNGDSIIKRCRYCGRLFVAERLSSDYCSRIQENEKEPCDVVGPKKSFARLMDEDHVSKTYNRMYKTIYARKKCGSISDDEFNRWKTEARSLLDKTRADDTSEESFEAWLTQDVRSWGEFGK